jgi:hypothetical protein
VQIRQQPSAQIADRGGKGAFGVGGHRHGDFSFLSIRTIEIGGYTQIRMRSGVFVNHLPGRGQQ